MLTIPNPNPAISADLTALGGAVRIIMAGGPEGFDDDALRRASGASAYLWRQRGQEIVDLAHSLAAKPDRGA